MYQENFVVQKITIAQKIAPALIGWSKMPQFILKITLGNDQMMTSGDVVRAITRSVNYCLLKEGQEGNIRDINGNTVGSWKVN